MSYIVSDLEEIRDNWQGGMATDAQRVEKWLNEREQEGYSLVQVIPEYRAYDEQGEELGTRDPILILHRAESNRVV